MTITKIAALAATALAVTACGSAERGEATATAGQPMAAEEKIVDLASGDAVTTTPAEAPPIATVEGSEPGTVAELVRLQRVGKVVTVSVRLRHTGDDDYHPHLEGDGGEDYTAEGLRLVDEINGREHFPLEGPDGECLCSRELDVWLEKGDSIGVTAKFPAPPAEVDRVSLHLPEFQSFDAVPLGQ